MNKQTINELFEYKDGSLYWRINQGKVIAGTKTFLFFLKLLTANDKCSAAVQELTAIECLTLKYLLHAFSNFPTFGP